MSLRHIQSASFQIHVDDPVLLYQQVEIEREKGRIEEERETMYE
jgi:hypothetical protein